MRTRTCWLAARCFGGRSGVTNWSSRQGKRICALASADIAPQRAEVTAAKGAAEAIEMMVERALEVAMRERERRAEAEVDDAAQRNAIKKR